MPKQTFFNLPPEKQETILKAAIEEFSQQGFDLSSIQRIITSSGIPRGSFYQYFEDKTDLFGEVMFEISKRKMKFLQPVMDSAENFGLYDLIREFVKAGVQFGLNDPVAFQIGKDIFGSKTLDQQKFLKNMQSEIYQRHHISPESMYYGAVQISIAKGEISDEYSMETILTYAQGIIEQLSSLYWKHMADNPKSEEVDHIIDEMISILQYGLSSSNKTS